MKHSRLTYVKNILFPCFVFSLLTGVFTGALIFLFKITSSFLFETSADIYGYVRENPVWLPCLITGAALIGFISSFILRHTKNCRGGGIPTSVALLRGLIEFRWLKSIFYLFATASLTFFGGVPLGNEGPSVQMGTAVGRGTIRIFAKKHKAWDRYIMTGGACAGFATATGAPLTGIFFAFEEAHRRFSPMLFMTAAMTVSVATALMRLLCTVFEVSPFMFEFSIDEILPLRYIWIAALVGIFCGLVAVVFTKAYSVIGDFVNETLKKVPFTMKIVAIFIIVSAFGFVSDGFIGSGHGIIHALTEEDGVWYILILYFLIRALFLMLANNSGISGGIFVPTLTFGALIGALLAKAFVGLGLLPAEYSLILIVIGMAAFLSASSRTPITALTFSLEAFMGLSNILPIAVGVTLSFIVIETFGITSLHDIVINKKVETFNKGKKLTVVDSFVTVMPDSFAVGKEARDILWPPTCTVLSVKQSFNSHSSHEVGIMREGDRLHIHYQTFEPETTAAEIEAIVGVQTAADEIRTHTVNEKNHIVPEM